MIKLRLLLIILFNLSVVSVSTGANIIYVDVNGPNDPGTGSYEDPFRKIRDAIISVGNNDVIEVQPGVYTGDGNYDLDPDGKRITIRSVNPEDPNIAANTVIDPDGSGRGFYFHSGEDANCIVSGFTIRNGYTDGSGGAIYCVGSSPSVSYCTITDNAATWGGGGIYCFSSNLSASNCLIASNTAGSSGGAAYYSFCNSPSVINCTIVSNKASESGDGVYCYDSNSIIINSILWSNVPEQVYTASGSVEVNYCDVQGGWLSGTGNIDQDPCFALFNPNGDPNMWDFHLQSAYGRRDRSFYRIDFNNDGVINLLDFAEFASFWAEEGDNLPADFDNNGTVDWPDMGVFSKYFLTTEEENEWVFDEFTSSCIDAGDPNSDWSGEPWPNGKRINMGVYGGTSEASKNGNEADFDVSGMVNFVDFADFSDKWLAQEYRIEDLTGDGVVDFFDLYIFADNWLWQKE